MRQRAGSDDFPIQLGSSPERLPDPDLFRDCIQNAYDALAAAR